MPLEEECPPRSKPGKQEAVAAWKNEVKGRQRLWYLCTQHCCWNSFRIHLPSICHLFETVCDCYQTGYIVENQSEQTLLKVHIAYSLYGEPSEENCDDHVGLSGYNSDQVKVVNDIFNIIKKQKAPNSKLIFFARIFIYVFPNEGDPFQCPVFRIPDPRDSEYPPKKFWFIDHSCRIYKGWRDYLRNNQLPKGLYCYPDDGIYRASGSLAEGRVKLTFEKTPACKLVKIVTKTLDVSASITGVGAGVVGVVGSLTPVAPVIVVGGLIGLGVSGVYSIVRSSVDLADRGNHGQSIGLKNRSARSNWICIVGSTLGLGAGGGMLGVSALAARGRLVSKLGTGIVTGLNAGSACVNGIGIVDNTVDVVIKCRTKGKEVSCLEIMQLVTSVVFFFNSVMNMKTARTVYKETQASFLESHKASLPSEAHRDTFNDIFQDTMAGHSSEEAGRAQVIRGVRYISNVDEAYGAVFQMRKSPQADELKVTFANDGLVVNGQQLVTESAGLLPSLTSSTGTVSVEASVTVPSQSVPNETPTSVSFGLVVVSNLHKLLVDLSANSRSVNFIIKALKDYCSDVPHGKWIFKIITMITDLTKCRSPEEYLRWACFVVEELKTMCVEIRNQLSNLCKRESNDSGNPSCREEMEEEGIDDLVSGVLFRAANKHPDEVPALNTNEECYHFPEHRSWGPEGLLKVEEYHTIANSVFKVENIDLENIHMRKNKATVLVDGKGVVQILSHKKERMIIVKTIRF